MHSQGAGPCLLLHRAIVNSGDFLIRERTEALLSRHRPDLSIRLGNGSLPIARQFDAATLSTMRAIVICGGPGYQRNMYPGVYPLAPLGSIRAPVFLLALGSFAMREPSSRSLFDARSKAFVEWVAANGGRLGTRDVLTERAIVSLGMQQVVMAGDPAWYDPDWLDRDDFVNSRTLIAFTPPANPLFHVQGLKLLRALLNQFGRDRLIVIFHRGVQRTFERECERNGVLMRDIAGSASGFAVYDEVGLHVGYRVHAHLYCTGHATPSYLIAEDSRGIGVLETLGPIGIRGIPTRMRASERVWSALPRVGSQRTELTRRVGLAIASASRLPEVSGWLLEQVERDRASGFALHATAKTVIRQTYPVMVNLLREIP